MASTALTRATRAATAMGLVVLHPAAVWANPQGGVVSGGSATITQASPKRLDVNQNSQRAVIDWRSFDIGKGEQTNFNQPSSSAVALNRIGDQKASQIQGQLTANGQVFLVNPNGVVFGPGSRVDVAGLIATTADIRNSDFMAGRYNFDIPSSNRDAMVVNQGDITIRQQGLAALVAPGVENSGVISANLGRVELAGATTFTVDFHGDGLMSFEVGGKVPAAPRGPDGQPIPALVSNSGKIAADGGVVHLTAAAAAGVVSSAIDMSGVIEARAVTMEGGKIVLSGSDTGRVNVAGTMDASGRNEGQKGGAVEVLGDQVALLRGTRIDVSGDKGGGAARIGGAFQGKGPQRNATKTYVASDAKIKADALTWGNGGQVIVWSDDATYYNGSISARGGAQGGDGGFVEVSGKQHLAFYGQVDVGAANGEAGTILLDPDDIFIVYGNSGQDDDEVGTGDDNGSPVFFADGTGEGYSSFTISEGALEALTGNVILQARRDITNSADLDFTRPEANNRVVFQAGRDITLNRRVTTNGAAIILEADSPHAPVDFSGEGFGGDGVGTLSINAPVASNGGAITLIGGDFVITSTVNAGAGRIDIGPTATGPLVIGSGILSIPEIDSLTAGSVVIGRADTAGPQGAGGTVVRPTADSISIDGPLQPAGFSNLTLISDGDITQTAAGETGLFDLSLEAGGNVFLNTARNFVNLGASSAGGDFAFDGLRSTTNILGLITASGQISINTEGNLNVTATGGLSGSQGVSLTTIDSASLPSPPSITMVAGSSINAGSGALVLDAAGAITAQTLLGTGDASVFAGGSDDPRNVTFEGSINGFRSLLVSTGGDVQFNAPVGQSQPLGNVVIGEPDSGFNINNPAIGDRDSISGAAAGVDNRGGDVFIAGPFRAAGTIIRVNTETGAITSGHDALNVDALFVDGRSADLFGTVAGATGGQAAANARTPEPGPDFLLNDCIIQGGSCLQPPTGPSGPGTPPTPPLTPPPPDTITDPVIPPVTGPITEPGSEPGSGSEFASIFGDPANAVLALEKQMGDLLTPPGSELREFDPALFAPPSNNQDDEDILELLSSSGNEELW